MPTIVQRVSNAGAQGTRWRATPNAHRRKDQTVKISENKEERTRRGWLIFTAVNWRSFIALQTTSANWHKNLPALPQLHQENTCSLRRRAIFLTKFIARNGVIRRFVIERMSRPVGDSCSDGALMDSGPASCVLNGLVRGVYRNLIDTEKC